MMIQTTVGMDEGAMVLRLLGNETRLTMMKILEDHDCCVCEFVEIFDVSQPSISQHLRQLRDIQLVNEARRGQWTFYSINKDSMFYPLVVELLTFLPKQDEKLKELEDKGTRIRCE